MSATEPLNSLAQERLDALTEKEWADLYVQLVGYAYRKAKDLHFVKGGGPLPLGREPEDIAREAIRRMLDGQRRWDPSTHPDLCGYLMDVIDSLVDGLLQKAGYARRDGQPAEKYIGLPSGNDPSEIDECFEAFEAICEEACRDEDAEVQERLENVRQGLEDGMKAGEIAEFFSMDVGRVYNATRKLRRRVGRAMADHRCNDHWQEIRN